MKLKILIVLMVVIFFGSGILHSEIKWRYIDSMQEKRNFCQALQINDSLILVMGGIDYENNKITSTCEFINVNTEKVEYAPSMREFRSEFKALLTKDSNVVVIGGLLNSGQSASTIEIFYRKSNTWQIIGKMLKPRLQVAADFINDEEILIVGGRKDAYSDGMVDGEIFNIKTGKSRAIANFYQVSTCGSVHKLKNGKMVHFGYRHGGTNSYRDNVVYCYDLNNNLWSSYSNLLDKVQNPTVTRDFNNNLIVSNGSIEDYGPLNNSNYIYQENDGEFNNIGQTKISRIWHGQAFWNKDSLMIIGGFNEKVQDEASTEVLNLKTGEIRFGPSLNTPRSVPIIVPIYFKTGKVKIFAIGGCNNVYTKSLKTIEVLEEFEATNTVVKNLNTGCDEIELEISSTNTISKVDMVVGSSNVKFDIFNLPSKLANIKIKLVNPLLNGFYKFIVVNEDGSSKIFSDSIYSKLNGLKTSSVINDYGILNFKIISVGDSGCYTLKIINTKSYPITVSTLKFKNGNSYIVKGLKLPFTIQSNQFEDITLCFVPDKEGELNDSLFFEDECTKYLIPVTGLGKKNDINISTVLNDCDRIRLKLSSESEIEKVSLNSESKNVKMTLETALPNKDVFVIIELFDSSIDGIYSIDVLNSAKKTINFKAKVFSKRNNISTSSSIQSNGEFDFKTVAVNDSNCYTIKITNKRDFILTINNFNFLKGQNFKLKNLALPVKINPKESIDVTLCFLPNQEGVFTDSLYLFDDCDKYGFALRGLGSKNGISINEVSNNCEKVKIKLSSQSKILSVNLNNESNNVKMVVESSLPNNVVYVTLELIDNNLDGTYSIDVLNSSNTSQNYKNILRASGEFLKLLTVLDSNRYLNFDSIHITNSKTMKLKLQNQSSRDFVLDSIYVFQKIHFSIPMNQIPTTLKPGDIIEIDVVCMPNSMTNVLDSLIIKNGCNEIFIRLKGLGIENEYSGESKCGQIVKGSTKSYVSEIQYPYPNPSTGKVTLIYYTPQFNNTIQIRDVLGNNMDEINYYIESIKDGEQYRNILNLDVTKLENGVYYLIADKQYQIILNK